MKPLGESVVLPEEVRVVHETFGVDEPIAKWAIRRCKERSEKEMLDLPKALEVPMQQLKREKKRTKKKPTPVSTLELDEWHDPRGCSESQVRGLCTNTPGM